ncbi:MAG: hypothetical protein AAGG69_07005 [Pseudomonadota bacterium]
MRMLHNLIAFLAVNALGVVTYLIAVQVFDAVLYGSPVNISFLFREFSLIPYLTLIATVVGLLPSVMFLKLAKKRGWTGVFTFGGYGSLLAIGLFGVFVLPFTLGSFGVTALGFMGIIATMGFVSGAVYNLISVH